MPSRQRVAALAVAVLAAACGGSAPEAPAPVAIAWHTCEAAQPGLQCGVLQVPEDRSQRGRRSIALNILVQRATRPAGPEPVFALAGGPGDASSGLLASVGRAWPIVREQRDLVLVDQRGTGRSTPLHCELPIADDPARAFGHVFDPAVIAACRETLGARHDLSAFTTDAAVEDLDDVRRALGYERILLWGGSYGSRLAQAYLHRHPDRVALAVLDAVAPLDVSVTARYDEHLQRAVDLLLGDCRRDPRCASEYPSIGDEFGRVVDRLRQGPAAAVVTRPGGAQTHVPFALGDFAYAVRGILYHSTGHEDLLAMIHRAAVADDFNDLADRYWQRAMRFKNSLALGLHLSVLCQEDVQLSPAPEDGVTTAAGMGGYLAAEYRRACLAWKVPARPRTGALAVVDVPVLLLSGRLDPATPPAFGAHAANRFPRGRHEVVADASHGVSLGCAREAVAYALSRATLEGLPPICK